VWQDSKQEQPSKTTTMTDVVFRISCPRLLVDHAAALSQAVCDQAPLVRASQRAGVHSIHVAGSQNGWERPEGASELLVLSKRTRLRIRIEKNDVQALIDLLTGQTLDVNGFTLHIETGHDRPLFAANTLLSRYTFFNEHIKGMDEAAFVDRIVEQCQQYDFTPTKVLCGREHTIATDNGPTLTRSVLLADVPETASVNMLDNGLGDGRRMGCGLFIPFKDTNAVHENTVV